MGHVRAWALALAIMGAASVSANDIFDQVEHGYADSGGVQIHYAAIGKGPLAVFIHGFPDFWYSWRHQMNALKDDFRCVAIDTRGYNLSGKPEDEAQYAMAHLVADVAAVIGHLGAEKAVIVGHDWGGAIAWQFVMAHPEMTERLVICNLPHPKGLTRELANSPKQQASSQYARDFQKEGSENTLTAEMLAGFIRGDETVKARYIEAFGKSSFKAMMSYYRQNYPREPYAEIPVDLPKIQVPVLMFHGLRDWALLPPALNGTWDWIDRDLTLVTIPTAGHWVHHDAAEAVSSTMRWWLTAPRG